MKVIESTVLLALAMSQGIHAFAPAPRVATRSPVALSASHPRMKLYQSSALVGELVEEEVINVANAEAGYDETVDVTLLESPPKAFKLFAKKGQANAKQSFLKTFMSAWLGGAYVGMGGMLSLAVSGNIPGVAAANPGLQKLAFAALFPVNLLLCVQCGGQLFTGNTAYMSAAFCEKRVKWKAVLRSWGISFLGNLTSCLVFAYACYYSGVLYGGPGQMAASMFAAKTSIPLGPCIVRAMACNWLVCLAVFLSFQAKDMIGKYISIFLCISTFVAIGFEHSVANMFILPAGILTSGAGWAGVKAALFKNLIPVTIGNAISGCLMVGAMFSFMFGRLGEGK